MNELPATIDLNPAGNEADAAIIWLHGLGADGSDFVPIVDQFGLSPTSKVRFIFPHAPIRAVTVNNGMRMRAWYDISGISIDQKEDLQGIEASYRSLQRLIEREESFGIRTDRIILAGFSQGGALSLYSGLRYPKPLGGIIALSAYLPLADRLSQELNASNQHTPIFMAHGLYDPIVPLMLGEMCRQQLEGLGYTIEWHAYPMPHTVIPDEINEIGKFIRARL